MRVSDLMTQSADTCRPEDNLAAAALAMWNGDCGMLPVVDDERRVIGVITDRDICMGLAMKHRRAGEILVREVMNAPAYTCRPGDAIDSALAVMARRQVRRLPVVDEDGRIVGVLSLNDVILETGTGPEARPGAPKPDDVVRTLQAIGTHRLDVAVRPLAEAPSTPRRPRRTSRRTGGERPSSGPSAPAN